MIGNRLLLDTNVVILLFKGDLNILTVLQKQERVYITVIVLGELYLGAYRSTQTSKKLEQIKTFLLQCSVLETNFITAQCYAVIKTSLLNKGKPVPENDIWIAATAMQFKITSLYE